VGRLISVAATCNLRPKIETEDAIVIKNENQSYTARHALWRLMETKQQKQRSIFRCRQLFSLL